MVQEGENYHLIKGKLVNINFLYEINRLNIKNIKNKLFN